MKRLLFLLLLATGFVQAATAGTPTPDPRFLQGKWDADWIAAPGTVPTGYGVYHFRKSFRVDTLPQHFVVNVSADNRYRLYINGTAVCDGPARGNLQRWYFETVDLAPYLQQGDNLLAAEVWNFAEVMPVAQISRRTAFIVQGNTELESRVNTSAHNGWRAMRNEAYTLRHCAYPLNDPSEGIDAARYPWGWETPGYDDTAWGTAIGVTTACGYGGKATGEIDWSLTPRDIPAMEVREQRIPSIRKSSGYAGELPDFLSGKAPLTIPANTCFSALLDQQELTNAYMHLIVSGGKGAVVNLTYAEALARPGSDRALGKIHRDSIDGVVCPDYCMADEFRLDGGDMRHFHSLWFKTYRYIRLDITTADEPVTVHDLYGLFTGYPFEERGSFSSDDPLLSRIWKTGWLTARLCAHETYFDCPYYEQLQYLGDTRIQAMISLYVSGDDRLMRKAIRMADLSRIPEGITSSRYPSNDPQYIPPFSLYWIGMINDFRMHRDDENFVREFLPGIRSVAEWFISRIDPHTGMLRSDIPFWNFCDWADGWMLGIPPVGEQSGSAILTLQLSAALRDAAAIMASCGKDALAAQYADTARELARNTFHLCWDPARGLLRDHAGSTSLSQHANIMGILSDAIPAAEQQAVFEKIVSDKTLTQTTFYYKFYLFRALKKVGFADRYPDMMDTWKQMLDIGLTTFAEAPKPTRSDCHAWSASPNYDLLATVCGIEPASAGFRTVRIAPAPGRLRHIEGVVPHPRGDIRVRMERRGKGIRGEVTLPDSLPGEFIWKGKKIPLHAGPNPINIR